MVSISKGCMATGGVGNYNIGFLGNNILVAGCWYRAVLAHEQKLLTHIPKNDKIW